ncbi:YebC/PmpR family DNA-binding transcriptional regulator [Candidatus Poribacteria bacterium]|nr:YebC/PmpR family DNA-binding transcriptional regulator [Candidatus Poribacteria bacterium]
MSGHSKWATIKRKKGANDAKRGALFTRLIREITIAARSGGDPASNPRLRTGINNARAQNMPNDTIEKAILRGTGELPGVVYEEIVYEGYGPGGVALFIEVTTDNRNRSASDVRHLLAKHGGNLGEPNSCAWLFERKGIIIVSSEGVDEEELMLTSLDAGAEDVEDQDGSYEIVVPSEAFEAVRSAVDAAGYEIESASLQMVPQTTVRVEGKDAERLLKLMDALDENDDVQNVYSNFDIDADLMESIEAA